MTHNARHDRVLAGRLLQGFLAPLTLGVSCTFHLQTLAAENPSATDEQATSAAIPRRHWVDATHDYVAGSANRLVQWMDDFYGTRTADLESASSRIRLRFKYGYNELEKGDFKVRVRGKIQLPQLSERLALVMEGEDAVDGDRVGPTTEDDTSQVGLQYKLSESAHNRFDGVLGINSGADVRTGVRFRHDADYGDNLTGRFVQLLAYQTGNKGAFSRTRAEGFRRLDEDDLLAWINRVEYGEDTDGAEWHSSLQWRRRLTEASAITYMAGLDGVTDPDPLTENYGVAINYRTTIFRKYLFAEIEPAYIWRKEADFDQREGMYAITLRFGIVFEKPPAKKHGLQQRDTPEAP